MSDHDWLCITVQPEMLFDPSVMLKLGDRMRIDRDSGKWKIAVEPDLPMGLVMEKAQDDTITIGIYGHFKFPEGTERQEIL